MIILSVSVRSLFAARSRCGIVAAAACIAPVQSSAMAQPCSGYWSSTRYTYSGLSADRLAVFDDGTGPHLYAGGLTYFPGVPSELQPVALLRWSGVAWEPVILDQWGQCNGLHVLEDIQGKFLYVSGVGSTRWARVLRPSGWSLPPPGLFSGTTPQAGPWLSFDDGTGMAIYGATEVQAQHWGFAKWNGAAWQVLGATVDGASFTAATFLDEGNGARLVISGTFTQIGNVACDRIARWTGSAWTPFPPLPNFGYTRALSTFDDGTGNALYVGGDSGTGTGPTYPLLKWTGQSWAPVTTTLWAGVGGLGTQVSAMHTFDDGRGPALFVAGYFASAGAAPANSLARWDGHAWEGVPGGIGFQTLAMASCNDPRGPSRFLAGTFSAAGGGSSPKVAQYVGCPNCYNNCDLSSAAPRLNVNDFMCFINAYARRDPYANCDLNSTINAADFICFMNKFAVGCP